MTGVPTTTVAAAIAILPIAAYTIPGSALPAGAYTVTIGYSGDLYYVPSSTTLPLTASAR